MTRNCTNCRLVVRNLESFIVPPFWLPVVAAMCGRICIFVVYYIVGRVGGFCFHRFPLYLCVCTISARSGFEQARNRCGVDRRERAAAPARTLSSSSQARTEPCRFPVCLSQFGHIGRIAETRLGLIRWKPPNTVMTPHHHSSPPVTANPAPTLQCAI